MRYYDNANAFLTVADNDKVFPLPRRKRNIFVKSNHVSCQSTLSTCPRLQLQRFPIGQLCPIRERKRGSIKCRKTRSTLPPPPSRSLSVLNYL